jgi:hypothetical protein
MELRIDIEYKQILKLIHQLPKEDLERLTNTLQSEISTKRSSEKIRELILNAPVWSDTDLNDFQDARNQINNSRIA